MWSIFRSLMVTSMAVLLCVSPLYPAQAPASGVILEAEKTQMGNNQVSAGATIFSGDVLTTTSEGHAQVRMGETRFQLSSDTEVAFFSTESGPVAELRRGSLIVSNNSASERFRIYASDILIVPTSDRPILGQVTLNSPCDVQITSEHGKLEATVGKETKTIEDAHSYDVRPEHSVRDNRMPAISPDDEEFHRGHNHATCAAAVEHAMKGPVAAGGSHFTIAVGAVGVGITIFVLKKALESPDRP